MYIIESVKEKQDIGSQLDFDYSCLIPAWRISILAHKRVID